MGCGSPTNVQGSRKKSGQLKNGSVPIYRPLLEKDQVAQRVYGINAGEQPGNPQYFIFKPPHQRQPAAGEEQADILADMVDESDRLIRLINDLLLLATADARRDLTNLWFEIQPLLEETIRQAKLLDQNGEITLISQTGIEIMGDRDELKQVISILLDNALKHSDGADSIKIDPKDGWIEIRIANQDPGIPSDELDRIFNRFYRSDASAHTPGFGLGLPIAKGLVESMGGVIAIESELSKGSVFTLQFPCKSQKKSNR